MGKTLVAVVGLVAAIGIAIAAPYLAPLALGVIGVTATATAVAVATAVIAATLSAGLALGMRALGVGAPSALHGAIGPPSVFRQTISNSFIVYGKRRVGGLLVFFHSVQGASGAHFRYFVIACAGHQCSGLVNFMLNDEIVSVDSGTGMVTSGKYANNAWLWFVRGTDTDAANATFVSECGGKWTSAHQGKGVAKIYAKFKLEDDALEAGMPNITAVITGKDEVYNGGYNANAMAVFYDWMLTPREEGGYGAYPDEMPDLSWFTAQYNVCEEFVNGEHRYELHGVITTGAPPSEIRDAMVVNCAGSYTFSGGKHLMRPGYYVPVTETLSEDDLAGPIQLSAFFPGDAAATELSGTYVSPAAGYQAEPLTTQKLASPPTDIRQLDVDLGFTTSKHQGDRILRIMLNRAQAETTVVWPMNIKGIGVAALNTVQLDTERYALGNYAFTVVGWSLSPEWGATLSLREENAEIYDEPSVVAPPTPPAIVVPTEPVAPVSEVTALISSSGVSGLTFSISDAGAVTISDHTRIYSDKSVSVTGTGGSPIASGGTSGQYVSVFYDQASRAGGVVTYQYLVTAAGADNSSAYASPSNPYRHFVLIGVVPAAGGSTGGGSSPGDGGGTSGPGGPGTVLQ